MSVQFYCEICGGLFNKHAKCHKRRFCDDCKPQAEKLYQAEYYKRRKGGIDQLRAALAAKDAELKVEAEARRLLAEERQGFKQQLAAKDAEIERLRRSIDSADSALSESPFHGQEELSEASLADGIRNYRSAVEAALAAKEQGIARLLGEIARADNALSEYASDFVSDVSLVDGIERLIEVAKRNYAELVSLKEILYLALSNEKCGADNEYSTVANDCTEGRCWHKKASAALANAEPEQKPATCVWTVNVTENSWILGCDESKDTSAPPKVCPYCKKRVEVRG